MSVQQIHILMARLANMHAKFMQTNYQLSALDKQSIKHTIEQLNIELISQQEVQNPSGSLESFTHSHKFANQNEVAEKFPAEEAHKLTEVNRTKIDNAIGYELEQPFDDIIDEPQPSPNAIDKPIDEVNNEIDELFFPSVDETQEVEQHNVELKNDVVLGLNERIMFAKDLFDNDLSALQSKIREFKEYATKEQMLTEFDNHYFPNMLEEGRDEEIISEFRALLKRVY